MTWKVRIEHHDGEVEYEGPFTKEVAERKAVVLQRLHDEHSGYSDKAPVVTVVPHDD